MNKNELLQEISERIESQNMKLERNKNLDDGGSLRDAMISEDMGALHQLISIKSLIETKLDYNEKDAIKDYEFQVKYDGFASETFEVRAENVTIAREMVLDRIRFSRRNRIQEIENWSE